MEQMLTVQEVAEFLRCSTQTVITLINEGYFPNAFRVSEGARSPYRIPKSDLDNYIKNQRVID